MKKTNVAIDLGTTNSVVAHWNDDTDLPEILCIDGISRGKRRQQKIDDSFTIPSCVYLRKPSDVLSFPFSFIFKRLKSKTGGFIGKQAIEKDGELLKNHFVNNFKPYLGENRYQPIAKMDKWSFSVHEITEIFLKTLLLEMKKKKGLYPKNLTFCVPVDFYEIYRANLRKIAFRLNQFRIKTIDEPIAAALGYGMGISDQKYIIVFDFGGGTLDLALVKIDQKKSKKGRCTVIAKEGVPIGGNLIDNWLLEDLCRHLKYDFEKLSSDPNLQWSYRILLHEVCKLKEALFFKEKKTFYFLPSRVYNSYVTDLPGDIHNFSEPFYYYRKDLIHVLEYKGLYKILNNLMLNLLRNAEQKRVREDMIDQVLMVGGSTLLPNVNSTVEKLFGRNRIRSWQPFNAIAFGAAIFSAGRLDQTDFITHDYAFLTYNQNTHGPEYNIIIPRGTVYPTAKDFWKRQLVPTCALGEPESIFKLVICEIGKKHYFNQEFAWDQKGDLHILTGKEDEALIVPLNESDPTLGFLQPPHYPSDPNARVEVSFMVNEGKWLCTTILDLKTNKYLMSEKPVIRLN